MDIARTPLAGRQPENLGEDPFLAGETVAAEVAGAKAAPRHRDAQALRRQQPGDRAHRLPPAARGAARSHGDQRPRVRAHAAGDLRGAVQARHPRGGRRRGHVLLQPRQRAADVRERGAARTTSRRSGLRRLRRAGLHLRRARRASPRRSPASTSPRSGRARRLRTARDVHVGPGPGRRGWTTSCAARCSRCSTRARSTTRSAPPADDVSTPEHRDLATRVSEDGMVLLKNDRHALPLSERAPRSIAVIGPSGERRDLHHRRLRRRAAGAPGRRSRRWPGIAARAGARRELERRAGVARRRRRCPRSCRATC